MAATRRPLRASHDHLVGSLSLWTKLRAHSGCVNTISWCADDPSLLASGSDDTRVLVWRVPPRISADEPLRPASTTDTGHTHNIFGVVFVPRTPGEVVTCAADGEVRHHDLEAQRSKLLLPTPGGGGGAFSDAPMAFKLAFLPGQPHALLCSYQICAAPSGCSICASPPRRRAARPTWWRNSTRRRARDVVRLPPGGADDGGGRCATARR